MSEIKLQDYAHYYIGCQCIIDYTLPGGNKIIDYKGMFIRYDCTDKSPYCVKGETDTIWTYSIKPILRKLEDMTDDECMVVNEISPYFTKGTSERYIRERLYCIRDRIMYLHLIPEVFHYCLKQGFDIFNLINSGLAIDSKTLK
jgi:hypothetical protein